MSSTWQIGEQGIVPSTHGVSTGAGVLCVYRWNAIGTDGYVQVTNEDERATGEVFGVQVKSGSSYLRTWGGGTIPVEGHGEAWRNANPPVIGVVHNPNDGGLWWVNLTEALTCDSSLRSAPVTAELPSVTRDVMPPITVVFARPPTFAELSPERTGQLQGRRTDIGGVAVLRLGISFTASTDRLASMFCGTGPRRPTQRG